MFERIPNELKNLPNWICWQAQPDPKSHSGISKKPIDPKTTGNLAKSTDPSTWADFETAVTASKNYSGIGFCFEGSGYFGVDLDDMTDDLEDFLCGKQEGIVFEFVHALQSYTELSQSKNGIHIICKGELPAGRRRKGSIEMYDSGRYFCMTGDSIANFGIAERSEEIKPLHEKYLGDKQFKLDFSKAQQDEKKVIENISTDDIFRLACDAKNGEKFKKLYNGDFSDYSSQSEADMAFCNMLAFWYGKDTQKMDYIFRNSGLMREKWDRKTGDSTYGQITLNNAISNCNEVFTPKSTCNARNFTAKFKSNKPKSYTFDDMGNAQRICDMFGDMLRYCYADKRWLWYSGKKWCYDLVGMIYRLADKSIESMKAEAKIYQQSDEENGGDMMKKFEKHCKISRSNKSKMAMVKETQHHLPVLPSQLDRHKMALNTPSGVISLKDGQIYEHKAEWYITKMTTAEYDPIATCPRWDKFLNDIFGGDKDLIRYIQKAVGYSLTGLTTEQCTFFLFGTGRNGKSTFLDIIRDIFGDYSTNIQPETIMIKRGQNSGANSDIARLKGARLVTSVEPNEGMRLNEGLLKQLTGGDVVTARKLYGDEFEFTPEFKLWIATNHKPIIRGTDIGIWRRIHLVPFTVQIPDDKVDKHLKEKLESEKSGIFNWCLEGCRLYLSEGLKKPKAVIEQTKEYQREMDVLTAFIEDRCVTGAGLSVQSSQLFSAYCEWSDEGNEYKMSSTKFGLEMSKRFEKVKANRVIFYKGISLN